MIVPLWTVFSSNATSMNPRGRNTRPPYTSWKRLKWAAATCSWSSPLYLCHSLWTSARGTDTGRDTLCTVCSVHLRINLRVRVRAVFSSAGSLLLRLRSLARSMRRSREVNLSATPCPPLLALHSRREHPPIAADCRQSGRRPTVREKTERLDRTRGDAMPHAAPFSK